MKKSTPIIQSWPVLSGRQENKPEKEHQNGEPMREEDNQKHTDELTEAKGWKYFRKKWGISSEEYCWIIK